MKRTVRDPTPPLIAIGLRDGRRREGPRIITADGDIASGCAYGHRHTLAGSDASLLEELTLLQERLNVGADRG
jgi:hypothetical protein